MDRASSPGSSSTLTFWARCIPTAQGPSSVESNFFLVPESAACCQEHSYTPSLRTGSFSTWSFVFWGGRGVSLVWIFYWLPFSDPSRCLWMPSRGSSAGLGWYKRLHGRDYGWNPNDCPELGVGWDSFDSHAKGSLRSTLRDPRKNGSGTGGPFQFRWIFRAE